MDRDLVYPAVGTNSPTHQGFHGGGSRSRRGPGSACDGFTPEKEDRPTNVSVYLAVCLFGLSGTLPTRAIWIELPTLTRQLPEGKTLSLYFLIILESANVAALAYLVARRFAKNGLSEIPFIYSCFALGLISLILTGCFWNHTTPILGQPNSFALLLSSFLAAIVSCVSIVTYIPFTARLRDKYITAIFLGEVLGSLIPQLLTVAQGMNRNIPCSVDTLDMSKPTTRAMPMVAVTSANDTNDLAVLDTEYHVVYAKTAALEHKNPYLLNLPKSTVPPALMDMPLRFNECAYFLICAAVLALSALCFALVRWCSACKFEYCEPVIDSMNDVELSTHNMDEFDDDIWQTSCDGVRPVDERRYHPDPTVTKLKDGACHLSRDSSPNKSSKFRLHSGGSPSPIYENTQRLRDSHISHRPSTGSEVTRASSTQQTCADVTNTRPALFPLLLVITFWTTAVLSGPLSPDKAYACFPQGSTAFLIGSILSQVAVIATCVVAARNNNHAQVTIVVALSCLGTILLTYFVALITFSHESESPDDSPLFGSVGQLLAAIAWTAVTALFSFARVTIGVLCRHSGLEAIIWYSYVTLFGAAVGTLAFVDYISICQVFRISQAVCR